MASLVQIKNSGNSVTASSIALAFASSIGGAGRLLICKVYQGSASATMVGITDTLGSAWHQAGSQAQTTDGHTIFLWYAAAAGAGACTVTAQFGGSVANSYIQIAEYNSLATLLDDVKAAQAATSTAVNAGTVTVNFANEVVILATGGSGNGLTNNEAGTNGLTMEDGHQNGAAGSTWDGAIADVDLVATGTQAGTATLTSSNSWSAVVAGFRAPGPSITTQPGTITVLTGRTAVFTIAAVASAGALHYQWTLNGSNVGADAASYGHVGVIPESGASVACTVTDSNGSVVSATALLLVATTPNQLPIQQRM